MKRLYILFVLLLLPTILVACDAGESSPVYMPEDQCVSLTGGGPMATCQNFFRAQPGGRNGDLDDSAWTVVRTSQATDPPAGVINNYADNQNAQICMMDGTTRTAGAWQNDPPAADDFFICGTANEDLGRDAQVMDMVAEPPHWMDSMNDNDQYVAQGARLIKPFDFSGRTGTMVFDVDAKTEGSHSAWPEIWLTPDPIQLPHDDFPGTHQFPREGVGFQMAPDWCDMPNTISHNNNGAYNLGERGVEGRGGIRFINEYHNFLENPGGTVHDPQGNGAACVKTLSDSANHFEIKIDTTHAEIWGGNYDGTNFHKLFSKTFDTPLNFTRGYWHFEHAQYAADKFNDMKDTTYHWHAIGFDGPDIVNDTVYSVPDALVVRPDGTQNLGYQTNHTFTINIDDADIRTVKLADASSITLNSSVYWYTNPSFTLDVVVNGHHISAPDPDTVNTPHHDHQWHYVVVPIPKEDLVVGDNTIAINNLGCGSDICPTISNIDLDLVA